MGKDVCANCEELPANSGIQWERCLVYIDDIVIMGKTFEHHLQKLETCSAETASGETATKTFQMLAVPGVYLGHVSI